MAQWKNLHRNNSFVNATRLPLLCEKSGAVALVLLGLTAGWLTIVSLFKKKLSSFNSTTDRFFGCLNTFLALLMLYQ